MVATYTPPSVVWSVGPWSGNPSWELRNITDRKATFSILESGQCSFRITGKPYEAIDVGEGINDIWIRRNGVILDRMRILKGDHLFNENQWSCSVECRDYRHLLDLRPTRGSFTYSLPTDQSTITWEIVTNGQSWGTLGIVQAPSWAATGVTRTNIGVRDGDSTWKAVMAMAQTDNGFEPYISPSNTGVLQMSMNYPRMGTDRGVVLDYIASAQQTPTGAVRRLGLTKDYNTYANAVRQYGAEGTIPVEASVANLANLPEGAWPRAEADQSLTTNNHVTLAAPATLAKYSVVFPEYNVELARGFWRGPSHIWLGDTVTQVVKAGQIQIERQARVQEISIQWDSNNVETVTLAVSKNSLSGRRLIRETVRRVKSFG